MKTLEASLAEVMDGAGFAPDLARPICSGQLGLPADPNLALIATDPVGIQQLVLSSRRMKTRLGASTVLARDWDRRWHGREDVAVVYAGGGQALLVAAARDAAAVVDDARQAFAEGMHGQLGAAWISVSPRELAEGPETSIELPQLGLGGGGFGALVNRVGALVRADKDAGRPALESFTGMRCAECGVRPRRDPSRSDGRCVRCEAFHAAAGDREVQTFDEIGRKLAFLAIDGTEVGVRLQEQKTLEEYSTFSRQLADAFSWDRIAEEIGAERKPLPIVRGGDDVLMVYEAGVDGTFEAASRAVGRIASDLHALGVGVGAGLVVSGHLPARRACALANALVRSAKDDAAQRGHAAGIDFEVVQSGAGVSEDIELLRSERRIRAAEGPWVGAETAVQPAWRPLSTGEAEELVDAESQALSETWSALYRLNERFHADGLVPTLIGAHYDAARCSADGRDSPLAAVLRIDADRTPSLEQDTGLLLRRRPQGRDDAYRWETAVPDLLDVHRMSREGR